MEVNNTTTTNINEMINTLILFVILGIITVGLILLVFILSKYLKAWYRDRNREKDSLDSVLLQIAVTRDNEIKIDATEQLFSTLYSIRKSGGFIDLTPQQHISFELVAMHESIKFYILVTRSLQDLIEKQIHGAYPDAEIKIVPEYNIFSESGQAAYTMYTLKNANYFPIKTFRDLPTDPMSALTAALAKMQQGEGAAVQLVIAPTDNKWKDAGKNFVKKEKVRSADGSVFFCDCLCFVKQ